MIKSQIKGVMFVEKELLKELRFGFVDDEMLRENLATAMQYITFLYSFEEIYALPGTLSHSVRKTIIVFIASIIESLMNYKLKALIKEERLDEGRIMGFSVDYTFFQKKSIPLSDHEPLIAGIKRVKKKKKLKSYTHFNDLNRAAKKVGLFTKLLFEKTECIRKKRNEIHLTALSKTDNFYPQSEIDQLFRDAKVLIDRIRDRQSNKPVTA